MTPNLSEVTLADALITARGDLFVAAAYMGCSVRALNSYIRQSPSTRALAVAINDAKSNAEFDQMSQEQVVAEVQRRLVEYRVEAVDEIHALATLPMNSNAAMMEVKLKAAIALKGSDTPLSVNNEKATILAELNQLYKDSAPRVTSIRAVQIDFDPSS